jgi:type II restriction/modification system DNA methylase subunit YeeA
MPVNTAALKTFAPAMRRQLLESVGRKLDLLLNSQTPDTLSTYAKQIAELREQEAENREQLLERVAYTWFNRLCALRYLDARGWHPFGCKVLMPAGEGETQPELLKLMRAGSLPAEMKPLTNEVRLHGLLDGQVRPAISGADPQGEVYRELVLASCRSYHQLLPNLFEGLDDASELLLPDDLLSDGSFAGGFRSQISDSDCEDVEIIGWLYQFYISEKKDLVIGKVVKSEDIPAATQLFTPNWIVKYMVQNSLGAQWLATYPASALKGQMEYYIEPAEQTDDVKAQLAAITPEALNPEELTLIDPACGSGHILVEAYELFKAIYLERGYQQREIPQLILEKNLFGLDIDERAAQLTSFALMMKGRGDDRRLFERGIQLNVMALVNSDGLDVEALANAINLADHGLKMADLVELKQLFEHATTFGSLIQVPDGLAEKLPALRRLSELKGQDIIVAEELKTLEPLVRQAEILANRYDSTVANPPYMGSKAMNNLTKEFAKTHFPDAKSDLFACFIERGYTLTKPVGYEAMVTMQSWMFLSSFQSMRERLLSQKTIASMAHLGARAFGSIPGEVVQTTALVLQNSLQPMNRPVFIRLIYGDEAAKCQALVSGQKRYSATAQVDFKHIPGNPIAYWASDRVRNLFSEFPPLRESAEPVRGVETGDNERFLKNWYELNFQTIGIGCKSSDQASEAKWFPYNKGGGYAKWDGFKTLVIDWWQNGTNIKNQYFPSGSRLPWRAANSEKYFLDGITWGGLTSAIVSFRYSDHGAIFDSNKGAMMFPRPELMFPLLGFLNSKISALLLDVVNPTLSTQNDDIGNLPFCGILAEPYQSKVTNGVSICVQLARTDWDNFETSWDFKDLPLLRPSLKSTTLEASWENWKAQSTAAIRMIQELETENNRLFIDVYGLDGELQPEVPEDQITLTHAEQRKDVAAALSYATACMMGRYSLDHPGLILANAGDTLESYYAKVGKSSDGLTFQPDPDGIIPVLDGEWFEDDIVARTREFLEVTFPESSVAENLRFIEDSLGKDIRKYFCSEFYKDHLQTYKKRPIYWLVQSPKKGFSCLIYLHRYTKDTLNQVLNNYFRPYLQKLEARLSQLGLDQLNDDLPTRERTAARKEAEKITKVLKECQAWEQDALLPLAQQRIELDLDDGVKVNYLKLQDVLAPIPGLAAKED